MKSINPLRAVIAFSLLSAMMIGLTACNTVAGAGKDTQKAGEHIENAADSSK